MQRVHKAKLVWPNHGSKSESKWLNLKSFSLFYQRILTNTTDYDQQEAEVEDNVVDVVEAERLPVGPLVQGGVHTGLEIQRSIS